MQCCSPPTTIVHMHAHIFTARWRWAVMVDAYGLDGLGVRRPAATQTGMHFLDEDGAYHGYRQRWWIRVLILRVRAPKPGQ